MSWHRMLWGTLVALAVSTGTARAAGAQCVGDCNGGGTVEINELILGVGIALGGRSLEACPSFACEGGTAVPINCLIQAVRNALAGCPATPTETAAGAPTETATPQPTSTATAEDTPTGTPLGTATATATLPAPPTGTATAAPSATPESSATATEAVPGTATATIGSAPSATPTATAEATSTATAGLAASETPTSTYTPTELPTATPTGDPAECDNGLLEPSETCETCPEDCAIAACDATTPTFAVAVDLLPPLGEQPTTATVLLAYRSSRLSLPGSGSAVSVRQRVPPPPPLPQAFAVNDLDYALRVVVSRNVPLARLFTATFDSCSGQGAPALADLACVVEGCASSGAPLSGCDCAIALP